MLDKQTAESIFISVISGILSGVVVAYAFGKPKYPSWIIAIEGIIIMILLFCGVLLMRFLNSLFHTKSDSLVEIVKIIEHIQKNDEKLTELDIKNLFGINSYNYFSFYCLGGEEPLAQKYGKNAVLKLTQEGVRKLYELRKVLADEKRAEWIKWATITLAIFSVLQYVNIINRVY